MQTDTPPHKCEGFFLQPARLLLARVGREVEAVCPEAFPAEAEVPLCPRVPEVTLEQGCRGPSSPAGARGVPASPPLFPAAEGGKRDFATALDVSKLAIKV